MRRYDSSLGNPVLEISPRSAARLRRFNIVGRSRSNRAPVCWSRQGRRDRFPGSYGLDDDVDPGQGAFDFTLHALNLALQECLQLLELGREPFESLYRICSQPHDRGLDTFGIGLDRKPGLRNLVLYRSARLSLPLGG